MTLLLNIASWLAVGLTAGWLSGMFGIGGGLIIVPLLVYFFKMNQLQAQGTSLMVLLPPVGLLAAMQYYKSGNVNIKVAICVAIGLFLGAYFGAKFATATNPALIKKLYGIFLILVGVAMTFKK